jgi:hypothetical protein
MTATADPPTAPVAVVPDPPAPAPAPAPKHRRRDGDTVPAWVAYSGVGVVGITALIVLAYYQHQFGARAQMPWLLSWTFSIGLDWGSAVAGVFWFFGRGDVKRWGRIAAIALLIGSTTITCVAWGMMSGWYWAPVGLIHPLVAFLMVKLLTVWQADRAERRAAADEQPDIIADLHQQLTDLRAAAEQDREQTATRLTDTLAELEHLTGQLADVRRQLAEREEELAAIERRKRADRRERERADDERREAQNRGPRPVPNPPTAPDADAVADAARAFMTDNPDAGRRLLLAHLHATVDPDKTISDHACKTIHATAKAALAA